jgi:hypothetical protein
MVGVDLTIRFTGRIDIAYLPENCVIRYVDMMVAFVQRPQFGHSRHANRALGRPIVG